ncbi:MAG: hypothetical protein GXO89_05125 [Chlorobi bacterium]|nr:hypothetical protein [Chlorobiota bacterium]
MKKTIIVIAVLSFFACNQETDYSPREVNYDRDICAKCLMGIADKGYAVQSISQWGEVVWFDDLGCYVNYFEGDDWNRFAGDGTVKSWIGNCETGEWIELGKAWFRFGDRTPMGYGYGALDTNVGDLLFDFNTTVKRIKDGKTKRKEFMEQRGMMGH